MGHKVPWKIGMLICHAVTSRPLILLQKEAYVSPCKFATTHLTASIPNLYLPLNFATELEQNGPKRIEFSAKITIPQKGGGERG